MIKKSKFSFTTAIRKLLFFSSLNSNGNIGRRIRRVEEWEPDENKLIFDEEYYLKNNPDVKASGMPALKHYLLYGRYEGRKYNQHRDDMLYPPGHFYSPVVNVDEIKKREKEIWDETRLVEFPGINLNLEYQIYLLNEFSKYYADIPFPDNKVPEYRFFFINPAFSYSDAVITYSVIRHFKPTRIIEVGSGYSSALILDTLDLLERRDVEVSFIEPYTEKLLSLLSDDDKKRAAIIERKLEQIDLTFFKQLEKNDILFIDSTHVAKTGSDVNYLLFSILPSLNEGVIIHFHDIFYPFEYPRTWVFEGRNWNEIYFLRAFLMFNKGFEIILFPDFLHANHCELFSHMPDCCKNTGGSFWIRKVI